MVSAERGVIDPKFWLAQSAIHSRYSSEIPFIGVTAKAVARSLGLDEVLNVIKHNKLITVYIVGSSILLWSQ